MLSVALACDFTQSFHEAIDLKETLMKISESSEQIRRIQKRLEVASAFAEQIMRNISRNSVRNWPERQNFSGIWRKPAGCSSRD